MLLKVLFQAFEKACNEGAVLFTPTKVEIVKDTTMPCIIRLTSTLLKKQNETKQLVEPPTSMNGTKGNYNPFLPYDLRVFVKELSTQKHVLLLNKFSIAQAHVLIVTKHFESQLDDINEEDMEAVLECLLEMDALIFYNCGPFSGASQAHKHLQVVPLPIIQKEELDDLTDFPKSGLPIEVVLNNYLDTTMILQSAGELGFQHVFAILPDNLWQQSLYREQMTQQLMKLYRNMLQHLKQTLHHQNLSHLDYNFLLTRRWMMIVPRKQETYKGIPINSMGFTGNLLARSHKQLIKIRNLGPLTILRHVTYDM
jgi:ATP adenylyltransferase